MVSALPLSFDADLHVVFLGVMESAVTPGFALFTSQWYTRREQGTRTGIWFSFNGFGQIFGGLVAYGIAVGARHHGTAIAPWKIVFLVNGCLTAALGVVFLFVMPDNQLNARWLKPRDRVLAIERVRVNQQGIGNKNFKFYQLKEALLDPVTWCICLCKFSCVPRTVPAEPECFVTKAALSVLSLFLPPGCPGTGSNAAKIRFWRIYQTGASLISSHNW